jgi:hypothetical protein
MGFLLKTRKPRGLNETDNTMAKRKRTKGKTTICKTYTLY